MGWLWGSDATTDSDPYRELDPELKEFLKKESPAKYTTAPSKPPASELQTPEERREKESAKQEQSKVPRESLYQDGRYAHLWKTYTPKRELEDATKSDQEKLMDVLDGYKERKHQIGRVAMENCANEQLVLQDCYEHGTIAEKMLLCRTQKKAYNRCYLMQSVCFIPGILKYILVLLTANANSCVQAIP